MEIYKFMKLFREFGWRHLIGLIFAIISLYPILYVITNSFADFANLANSKLIPDGFTTKHYQSLTGDPLIPYYKWLFNTYKIAGIAGFLNVLLGTFAAFAFARLKFKGRRVGLITLVLVQMFPSFLAFVAIYLLFFKIGDVAQFVGLGTHIGIIFIYLAKVDGATDYQIFYKIIAPLSTPIIVVLFVITFIGIYSDYILAAIFLKDANLYTVALGINIVFMDDFSNEWGSIAAASVIAATPIDVLFLFFQKQITGGLTAGSIKG